MIKYPSYERAKELFNYNENTGVLSRRRSVIGAAAGDIAGYCNPRGYLIVRVDTFMCRVHRIIWLMKYGYLPELDIDHINRNPSDNRIKNLREVSRGCNLRNTGNRKGNTSGVKGVSFHKKSKKWVAHIGISGGKYHIGKYSHFYNAVLARLTVERCLGWYECDSLSPAHKYAKKHGLIK